MPSVAAAYGLITLVPLINTDPGSPYAFCIPPCPVPPRFCKPLAHLAFHHFLCHLAFASPAGLDRLEASPQSRVEGEEEEVDIDLVVRDFSLNEHHGK